MRILGWLTVLAACTAWLGIIPAIAETAGKAVTHTTNTTSKMQSPGTQPRPPHLPTRVTAVPLTKGECEGLGGKVDFNASCAAKGQSGCYTVDSNGVIHMACINRK